jgi:host factor-I protein
VTPISGPRQPEGAKRGVPVGASAGRPYSFGSAAQALRRNTNGAPTTMDKKQNLQDTFLNAVRKAKTPLTIFLVNGVKLQGVVTWFDNFCILLRRDGQVQLVYKHAISTIMPGAPVQLYEIDKAADEADG